MNDLRCTCRPIAVGGLVLALSIVQGCSRGLEDIDRDVDRLVQAQSGALGPSARAPRSRFGEGPDVHKDIVIQKTPPTINPSPEQLEYPTLESSPEDEAAEVERRLRAFQDESLEGAIPLTLEECFRIAQRSAQEYLNQEEEYLLAAIRLLIERHQWGPRLFNTTTASVTGVSADGDWTTAARVLNELEVTQRLPYGGEVAARWLFDATNTFREMVSDEYVQSSALAFDASFPLLRGAGYAAQEALIQAERDLVYAARDFETFRRQFLVDIARDYIGLLQLQTTIENTNRQLESLRMLERREAALYDAGRVPQFRLNIARSNVLQTTSALASQRETYVLRLDAFKIRLGIPISTRVQIQPGGIEVPLPDVTLQEAVEKALTYRLDLQNQRDRVEDARRAVRNARNELLPILNLNASVTIPTDPDDDVGGVYFQADDTQYSASATLGLPLDREIERLQLKSTIIGLQRSIRNLGRFRDELVLDVRAQVREIERARFALLLADEQVRINERRQFEQRLREDEVDTQQFVDTENDLIQARNNRAEALTDLRIAILEYLVRTGQMRVRNDGQFDPLPGMRLGDAEDIAAPRATPPDLMDVPPAGDGEPVTPESVAPEGAEEPPPPPPFPSQEPTP